MADQYLLPQNELNVAYDPTTGVAQAERLGYKVSPKELVNWCGYEMDEVTIFPDSIETKCWPTSMKLDTRDEDGSLVGHHPVQVWNHYLRLKFEPRHDEMVSRLVRDELLEEIRAEKAGAADPVPPQSRSESGVVVELDLFDAHFQMLAWGPETGTHDDLEIKADRFREAARYIRDRAIRDDVSRWLLVVGNDLFHADTTIQGKGGATTHGTPQDVDTRLAKAARVVRRLLTDIILDLLAVAPVDVLVIPGNHDEERSWWMGEVLDARFEGNEYVRVDNRPMLRKYYRVGNSLIGFSHGHRLKDKDLRDHMTREAPDDFAACEYFEWHVGHLHHEYVRDTRGVVVRQLPALAGTDKWHFENGFVGSQKGARGLIWSRDRGMVGTINYNIPRTQEERDFTAPMLRGDT